MHMLLLLTAILTSHPVALEASVPAHHERGAFLLASGFDGRSRDHGSSTRYLVEYLSGLGLETAGVVAGFAATSDFTTLRAALLPSAFGVLGSSVGVALAGWAMDGRGRAGFALLGGVIGYAAPLLVGTGFILASGCGTQSVWNCGAVGPTIIGMLLLTPVGSIVAYELSAPRPWLSEDYASRAPRPAPRFVPVVTLARQGVGGTLGIAGRL